MPLHFILITDGDGNTDWDSSLPNLIEFANSYFTNDMEFNACNLTIMADDNLVTFVKNNQNWQAVWNLFHDDDAINVYLFDQIISNGASVGGTTPWIEDIWGNSVALAANSTSRVLGHELGHYFGLLHTDAANSFVNSNVCWSNTEWVCGPEINCVQPVGCESQCIVDGDYICDTPADPGLISANNPNGCPSSCSLGCSSFDPLGEPYNTDKQNVMSQYGCNPQHFSPQQLERMWLTLNNHANRVFLLTTTPSCAPSPLPSDYGRVERACVSSTGTQVEPVENFQVDIVKGSSGTCTQKIPAIGSPDEGKYTLFKCGLYNIDGQDVNVNVAPKKEDVYSEAHLPLNGVEVQDIVLLIKHILGAEILENWPYGLIAADVNNSGSVSISDVVIIRKVMLSIEDYFPNGSWRFLPSYYLEPQFSFQNDFFNNPFSAVWNGPNGEARPYLPGQGQKSYMDQVDINMQNPDRLYENTWSFHAIKSGDVDCSATLDFNFVGNDEEYYLTIPGHNCFNPGESAILTIKGQGPATVYSYQFGFSFDPSAIEIVGVTQGQLPSFTVQNFGLTKTGLGEFRTIWFDENANSVDLSTEKTLFQVHVKFHQQVCDLSSVIRLDDEVLNNCVFDEAGAQLPAQVKLEAASQTVLHALKNVFPNPFSSGITFEFELGASVQVQVSLADGYGNLSTATGIYPTGTSTINLQQLQSLQPGILYYTVQLGSETYTGNVMKQ